MFTSSGSTGGGNAKTIYHRTYYLFAPIHMKSSPKVKLGKVQVGSNIAQNHSSSPYLVIICKNSNEKLTKSEIR